MEKLEEAKGGDDGGLWEQGAWVSGNITSADLVSKKLKTSYPGGEISKGGQGIPVRNSGSVEETKIATGSPGTIRFRL